MTKAARKRHKEPAEREQQVLEEDGTAKAFASPAQRQRQEMAVQAAAASTNSRASLARPERPRCEFRVSLR